MKQNLNTSPSKYYLTLSLVGLLAVNYLFQQNSRELLLQENISEFASNKTCDQACQESLKKAGHTGRSETVVAPTTAPTPVAPTTAPATQASLPTSPAPTNANAIESAILASGFTCNNTEDCKSALQKLIGPLVEAAALAAKTNPATQKTEAAAVATVDVSKCTIDLAGKPETTTQKLKRQTCEKTEKERFAKREATEAFKARVKDIRTSCKEEGKNEKLSCLSTAFAGELNDFDEDLISKDVVRSEFAKLIGADLKKSLYNDDLGPEEMAESLYNIFNDIPEEFSELKKSVLTTMNAKAKEKAAEITKMYKESQVKALSNPAEAAMLNQSAQAEQAEFFNMAKVYNSALMTSDVMGDSSFKKYYTNSYLPSLNSIYSGIIPNAALTPADLAKKLDTDLERIKLETSTRARNRSEALDYSVRNGSIRNLRSGTATGDSNPQRSAEKWIWSTTTNGVNFGTPTRNSMSGGRTGQIADKVISD